MGGNGYYRAVTARKYIQSTCVAIDAVARLDGITRIISGRHGCKLH